MQCTPQNIGNVKISPLFSFNYFLIASGTRDTVRNLLWWVVRFEFKFKCFVLHLMKDSSGRQIGYAKISQSFVRLDCIVYKQVHFRLQLVRCGNVSIDSGCDRCSSLGGRSHLPHCCSHNISLGTRCSYCQQQSGRSTHLQQSGSVGERFRTRTTENFNLQENRQQPETINNNNIGTDNSNTDSSSIYSVCGECASTVSIHPILLLPLLLQSSRAVAVFTGELVVKIMCTFLKDCKDWIW